VGPSDFWTGTDAQSWMTLSIAAVVPNYNYAGYLPQRLASIRAQCREVDALIFLDDASTDDSMAVATAELASWTCPVQVLRNERNTGFVLGQWRVGMERAGTDLVWIAEADDGAKPGLLAALAARMETDPGALFAFCDSAALDATGACTAPHSKEYITAFDPGLARDGVFEARQFLSRFLCPRNSVLCSSAVLWRRTALARAFDRLGEEAASWFCAGDWRLYVEACGLGGRVHFVAEPLNEHRRHGGSVTGGTPRPRHFAEVVAMLSLIRRRIGAGPEHEGRMRAHLAMLRRAWRLDGAA
jgi:glycosyltransferase involved in cell wall biosynthesis